MKVATRLRGAFAVYIVLLAAVVFYHVRTIERTVASGHALSELATRSRVVSAQQSSRLGAITRDIEKFLVTHDIDYLKLVVDSADAFGRAQARIENASLTPSERSALVPLRHDWRALAERLPQLARVTSPPSGDDQALVEDIRARLGRLSLEVEHLGAAAQDAMAAELETSEASARTASRLSWLAALGALVLSILLSALLARSILAPLQRLAEGAREVAAGRYEHRLDASGDDELANVARDFNSMTARLGEVDRMKRDFSAKVSHDLKTPLSSMQETISAILDGVAGPVTPKQRHLLELNLESGRRLGAMLGKLLDLSRIEAGLTPAMQLVDVAAVARRSVERAAALGGPAAPAITFVAADGRMTVRGDEADIAQVVDNLLENAMKFSPAQGQIDVRVVAEPTGRAELVALSVSDEGPGIPAAEKERVFERYYQTGAGRAVQARGVGLGLAICREIVAAHGGSIRATDNAPRGTTFTVTLPAAS